ncbi:DUF3597 domain-containing protein [Sphingomonas sp.]|uniref:DUF3597 domain-containing protein n=1 Tax=Sphingomonas sp. TaxID=28214 RepID=UPI003B3BC5F2
MGIFDSIKHAIFGDHGLSGGHPTSSPEAAANPATANRAAIPMTNPAPQAAPAAQGNPAPAAAPVDIEAILTQRAAAAGHPSNWRTSIVDLLQLLGLDSDLQARKELASELNIHAGPDGSAEQNIALHKAVMQRLAANGGKVPAELVN